jgi:phytanoyl-CoA hydroxylase
VNATASATASAVKAELTPAQLEHFDREGYIVVEDLFTTADLQPVIDEVCAEIDTLARASVAKGELSQTFEDEDFATRLAKISLETHAVAHAVWNGSLAGPAFFNLIRHPRLLDIAEGFCGPELIASSVYRLRPKIPKHRSSPVPWHQDSGYMEPYCDKAMVLTVWLPLVDANEENGSLWVIPGVH